MSSGLSGPKGVAVDAAGNVYISDSGNNRILKETFTGSGYTESVVSSSFSNPQGLTADSNGNLYVANNGGPLNFLKLNLTSVPFGSQAVGVASSTIALPFTVTSGTTIGSISVLTTGLAGKDYADAGSSTCTAAAYGSDTACVVNVKFTPLAPGLRHGAVVIKDGSNHVLASVSLSGFGTGSQAVYGPSSAKPLGSSLGTVFAMATDAAGNVYIADSGNAHVVKITPAGTQTNLGSSHHQPHSVAVDGEGNVFVGEVGTGSVAKITPAGVQTTVVSGLNEPYGLLFDAAGNLIICDPNLNQIFNVSPLGVQTTIASGFTFAAGIAEDSAGNLYITDAGQGSVVRITPAGVRSNFLTGLNVPAGVAIDASGTFYIAEFGNGQIVEIVPGNSPVVLASGGSNPFGITLDDGGNLFFTDSGSSKAFQIARATPPSLAFADTAYSATSSDSPRTVQVQNTGNAALNFVSISYPTDFPEDGSGTADCSTSSPLIVSSSCSLTIDFSPVSNVGVGPNAVLSENVAVTTDNLAAPLQNVAVSGKELGIGVSPAPTFSTPGGTYNNAQSITISDTDPGTIIYYTINGSTPTASSRLYAGPVAIRNTYTLKAIAASPGKSFSSVVSATYTLAASTPVFSVAGGLYATQQSVSLSTDSTTANIYYTTNGTTPNIHSTLYTAPITVNSNLTLKAIAVATGYTNSGIASASYIIQAQPATPTISPASGTYNNAQSVTISESVPGATIYYTINGTTPTTSSTKYTVPFAIRNSFTVKAIAVAPGYGPTSVATATYNLTAATPVVDLASGTYTGAQTANISCASTAARIYYTINGSKPTANSTLYTGPITVGASETLKVVAIATGYTSSPVVTNSYIIQ